MIPLETEFIRKGWMHRQIRRTGDVATFARHHVSRPEEGHYEVVVIRIRPTLTVFGKEVPAHEVYPPSEAWGTDGWTYGDEDAALEKFRAVVRLKAGTTGAMTTQHA
jgi:hypothetical protein